MKETYPIPEALTKSAWEIVDGQTPKLLPASGKIVVPLSPDQHDQVLRTHELAHLKWSPTAIPKDINPAIVAMVEDARIICKMRGAKVNLEPGYPEEIVAYTAAKLRATGDRWGSLLFRIGMTGMPGQDVVDKALAAKEVGGDKGDESQLASLRSSLTPDADAEWTIRWARHLDNYIKKIQEEEQEKQRQQQQAASGKKSAAERTADDMFAEKATEKMEKEYQELASHFRVDPDYAKRHRLDDYEPDGMPKPGWWDKDGGKIEWGEMEIEEPPRTQRMPGRFGRQRRPSDVGAALNYPSRLWQDAKVFGRKLRGHGGSVLIDGSGSMSLTPKQIWEILENAPGASIAIYSSTRYSAESGILRILAKKGLVVKASLACSSGSGNVVDFPALKWLAKQEEPRIWVSDAMVTGIHDRHSGANQAECFDLCRRNRILRVQHMPQAIAALEAIRLRRIGVITNTMLSKALK